MKLTQAEAESRIRAAGISIVSSVDGIITLKRASGASITIVGGTEVGHAAGTRSHANGFKLDIRHNSVIDAYIKRTFQKIANRGDGFPQWRSAAGNLYCDEGNHWDITYL